jgi:hypothetical protein
VPEGSFPLRFLREKVAGQRRGASTEITRAPPTRRSPPCANGVLEPGLVAEPYFKLPRPSELVPSAWGEGTYGPRSPARAAPRYARAARARHRPRRGRPAARHAAALGLYGANGVLEPGLVAEPYFKLPRPSELVPSAWGRRPAKLRPA